MGRRRVLIVAIIPGLHESNDIFLRVYEQLALPVDEYFHTFHADLKAIAFATVIDSGSASHPCYICESKITCDNTETLVLSVCRYLRIPWRFGVRSCGHQ